MKNIESLAKSIAAADGNTSNFLSDVDMRSQYLTRAKQIKTELYRQGFVVRKAPKTLAEKQIG